MNEQLAKQVLEALVNELNTYNQNDMLSGYLNSLQELEVNGTIINRVLEELGLPILEWV